ncbi:hypothetical protein [Pontibacillus litoralis]|nr:hypothetical protein [Pontibacillus litoralis]
MEEHDIRDILEYIIGEVERGESASALEVIERLKEHLRLIE